MSKFRVVKCFSCDMYQVDQAKKAKQWKCKVCGEKQSLKKIIFDSDFAKDCRSIVQELNMKKINEPLSTENLPSSPRLIYQPEITGILKWNDFIAEEKTDSNNGTDQSNSHFSEPKSIFSILDNASSNKTNNDSEETIRKPNQKASTKPTKRTRSSTNLDQKYIGNLAKSKGESFCPEVKKEHQTEHILVKKDIVFSKYIKPTIKNNKTTSVQLQSKILNSNKWSQFTENNKDSFMDTDGNSLW